ncbi:MAG: hypothetical protein WAW85_02820, partial [Gordonia sp. (in: high G+C Gram-positive bacteria)]
RPLLVELDSSQSCESMQLADLTDGAQKTVNDASIRNLTSRGAVENSLSRLIFLPCAAAKLPEQPQSNERDERPDRHTPTSGAPRSTQTGSSSAAEKTASPKSTSAPVGTTEKTRDCSGN